MTDKDASRRMYQFLCNTVIGSEKIVKYRRQYFYSFNHLHTDWESNESCVCSGSRAEGMDLPGSDIDIMYVRTTFRVNDKSKLRYGFVHNGYLMTLIMEPERAQPGFTLIRVIGNGWKELVEKDEFGTFLSSRYWKEYLLSTRIIKTFTFSGPCLTRRYLIDMDLAWSLPCFEWPEMAKRWCTRSRLSGWPSETLITNIREMGVLLVPIGSKSDSDEDNPLEWRISFSIPEKILISSWNHVQFLCYGLLKIFTKELVKRHTNVDKLICSYFLKTTMLWLSEEHNSHIWTTDNLLDCFMLCLKRLIYMNSYGFIPNYFIPEHNLIDRKFYGQPRSNITSILNMYYRRGWKCLLHCDSLSAFKYFNFSATLQVCNYDFDKAVFPLLTLPAADWGLNNETMVTGDSYLRIIHYFITNSRCSGKIKSLSLVEAARAIPPKMNLLYRNQLSYRYGTQWMPFGLIGTLLDSITGWIKIAFYFYLRKEYLKSLEILNYIESTLCIERLYCATYAKPNMADVDRLVERFSTSIFSRCDMKWKVLKSFSICNQAILNMDTNHDIFMHDKGVHLPPIVVLHHLSFLCHHHLHNKTSSQESLHKLLSTVQNEYYIKGNVEKFFAAKWLGSDFRDAGYYGNALYWLQAAARIRLE